MLRGREARLQAVQAQEEQRRLSREQLLGPKPREEEVEIAELGGTVVMRTMTHGLRKELRTKAKFGTDQYDDDLFTRLVIVHTIVDPKLTEEDVAALEQQDITVFDEIVMKISMFNLMGSAEALKKDSSQTQNSDSPSSSQNDLE